VWCSVVWCSEIVCGDLTLMNLGFPSAKNVYLFNGDYVDRGAFGVEICVVLFLFKLSDPSCIYMNRGNHECTRLNQKYAFEVKS